MSTAARWYASREAVKKLIPIAGSALNSVIDGYIESASAEIETQTYRRFIPYTAAKSYPWPQRDALRSYVLHLDEDLLSVSSLTRDGTDVTDIAAADYFLEPVNSPPYQKIEIDLSSSAYFGAKDTHQRAIVVTGSWGYSGATKAAGTVASGLAADAAATSCVCSDGSLIDVGDTLLIGTEQLFVSERATVDTTANLNDTLTANLSDTGVTVTDGTQVKAGEVILIESERMLVESVSGNVLTVIRGYDGSTLAAHSGALDVYAYRTLTVVRGVNGTTAAVHANSTAIAKYAPEADIVLLCKALAIGMYEQGRSGWTGQLGGGEAAIEGRMSNLRNLREDVVRRYRRKVIGAV